MIGTGYLTIDEYQILQHAKICGLLDHVNFYQHGDSFIDQQKLYTNVTVRLTDDQAINELSAVIADQLHPNTVDEVFNFEPDRSYQ